MHFSILVSDKTKAKKEYRYFLNIFPERKLGSHLFPLRAGEYGTVKYY